MSSILKIASIVCALALIISFAAFASDEAGSGSKKTVAQIAYADDGTTAPAAAPPTRKQLNEPSPPPRVEKMREKAHSGFREAADDANDVLTAPFASLAGDGSIWAQRIVTGLLALLLFGAGLGFLSRLAALRGI